MTLLKVLEAGANLAIMGTEEIMKKVVKKKKPPAAPKKNTQIENLVYEVARANALNTILNEKLERLESLHKETAGKLTDASDVIEVQELEIQNLKQKNATIESNCGLTRGPNNEWVPVGFPELKYDTGFYCVKVVDQISLFEAAMQIVDMETRVKATDAIAEANAERQEVRLGKLKSRVIEILIQQHQEKK